MPRILPSVHAHPVKRDFSALPIGGSGFTAPPQFQTDRGPPLAKGMLTSKMQTGKSWTVKKGLANILHNGIRIR